MKRLLNVSCLLLMLTLLCGCDYVREQFQEKDFYSYSRDGDLDRLPLIEPYQLISADGGFTWLFEVPFGDLVKDGQIAATSVWVENERIFLYAPSIYLPGEMTQAWFVFNTQTRTSAVFKDRAAFSKVYSCADSLRSVSTVFATFEQDLRLPWRK